MSLRKGISHHIHWMVCMRIKELWWSIVRDLSGNLSRLKTDLLPITRGLYLDIMTYLSDDIFTKMNWASMENRIIGKALGNYNIEELDF